MPKFDPDAQAFITAAAITDVTQQNAINTLVINLKTFLFQVLSNSQSKLLSYAM